MKNKFAIWFQAARPKTLPASISPVILGASLAYCEGTFDWLPAVLCLLVALFAQIASNFANDYFDFKQGADGADRLGPERAVAQGWTTPRSMLIASLIAVSVACIAGCLLVAFADWRLLLVGVAIVLCVFAYSAGPFPLAYNGLGDICVLLFYGIIPVCFTYFIQTLSFSMLSLLLSVALGLLSVNILVVNNYRDFYQDKKANKRTTVVLFGRRFGRVFYVVNECISLLISLPLLMDASWWMTSLFGLLFVLCYMTTIEVFYKEGKDLNKTLGHTARNVFLYAILMSIHLISLTWGIV